MIQNTAPSHCALQNELLLGLCVNTIHSCCARAGDAEPNRDQRQQMTANESSVDETWLCFIYLFIFSERHFDEVVSRLCLRAALDSSWCGLVATLLN